MKKFFKGLVALAVVATGTGATMLRAEMETEPLYKYDATTGTYDESQPMPYYSGSPDNVEIAASYDNPKEEFKGTWIGTIFNLHFPKEPTEAGFKARYESRLDDLEDWNMNAVIFQVRPLLDAFYPSELNPTSEFLSGTQGVDVDFDALEYMVEATHARGMEYHAWFNPYRVTNSDYGSATNLTKLDIATQAEADAMSTEDLIARMNEKGILADTNYAVLHPEHVVRFGGKLQLDPGIPEVVDYVLESITEVIDKYDVDAIHFDDYFYPYKGSVDRITGSALFTDQDAATFAQYGVTNGYSNDNSGLEEWRRDNVTSFIKAVKDKIDDHNAETKSSMQFGISPFGIWEHYDRDPKGSHTPTSSSQSYSGQIFADSYDWVKNNYVDYIMPQIYWAFGTPWAPYGELTRWWNNVAEGTDTQVYIGHSNYKQGTGGDWNNPDEITNQIRFNQTMKNVYGSGLYGYADIMKDGGVVKDASIDSLKGEAFALRSLSPAKPKLSHGVELPTEVILTEENTITWKAKADGTTRFFHVYEGSGALEASEIIATTENLVATVFHSGEASYTYEIENFDETKQYIITAEDKAHVESEPTVAEVAEEESSDNNEEESSDNNEEESSDNNEETPKGLPEWITMNLTLTYEVGQKVTEEQLIKDLNVKSEKAVSVKTNFANIDLSTEGKKVIKVTLTEEAATRAVGDVYTADVTVDVTKAKTQGKDTEGNLPATGEKVGETIIMSSVLLLVGAAIVVFVYKRKATK